MYTAIMHIVEARSSFIFKLERGTRECRRTALRERGVLRERAGRAGPAGVCGRCAGWSPRRRPGARRAFGGAGGRVEEGYEGGFT